MIEKPMNPATGDACSLNISSEEDEHNTMMSPGRKSSIGSIKEHHNELPGEGAGGEKKSRKQFLKVVSLVTLTFQNASLTLCMRAARTQSNFLSSTAVIMSELLKLITCFIMVYFEERSVTRAWNTVEKIVIRDPFDTLKVAVPAIVYYVQNNLIYVAATHLDAATSQVTYQLKILTTALFAVFLLKKKLIPTQWLSLFLLFVGVAMVQLTSITKKATKSATGSEQSVLIGFMAILTACFLSGFAGVYFEKILKNSHVSLWIRNIQLAAIAIPFGLIQVFFTNSKEIQENGFFHGYSFIVWTVIFLQAQGGLLVAVVVKYADNILKGFATSISIIVSCVASMFLFDFVMTTQFFCGAALVISSVFLYNHQPTTASSPNSNKKSPLSNLLRLIKL